MYVVYKKPSAPVIHFFNKMRVPMFHANLLHFCEVEGVRKASELISTTFLWRPDPTRMIYLLFIFVHCSMELLFTFDFAQFYKNFSFILYSQKCLRLLYAILIIRSRFSHLFCVFFFFSIEECMQFYRI